MRERESDLVHQSAQGRTREGIRQFGYYTVCNLTPDEVPSFEARVLSERRAFDLLLSFLKNIINLNKTFYFGEHPNTLCSCIRIAEEIICAWKHIRSNRTIFIL